MTRLAADERTRSLAHDARRPLPWTTPPPRTTPRSSQRRFDTKKYQSISTRRHGGSTMIGCCARPRQAPLWGALTDLFDLRCQVLGLKGRRVADATDFSPEKAVADDGTPGEKTAGCARECFLRLRTRSVC